MIQMYEPELYSDTSSLAFEKEEDTTPPPEQPPSLWSTLNRQQRRALKAEARREKRARKSK